MLMHIQEEAARCLFCQDAPCTKACGKGDPARAVRAIRFDNEQIAAQWLKDCTETDLARAAFNPLKNAFHQNLLPFLLPLADVLAIAIISSAVVSGLAPPVKLSPESGLLPYLCIC